MEKEKDSEKDKKKEANLSLHIVELSDTADAEVGGAPSRFLSKSIEDYH